MRVRNLFQSAFAQLILFVMVSFVVLFSPHTARSQELVQLPPLQANCGDIIESEFTTSVEMHTYLITVNAGDRIIVNIVPLGTTLQTRMLMHGPTDIRLDLAGGHNAETFPSIDTDVLSGSGTYKLFVANFHVGYTIPAGVGVYTLYIGCTLRNGTVINPGDTINPPPPPVDTVIPSPISGFPGLAPVDFSGALQLPLPLGQFINGQMPVTNSSVVGFTFSGNPGEIFDLQFLRQSGNLNLGLAVMSPSNKVVFQLTLISSDLFMTRFRLEEAGQYIIGVYRLDLNPPVTPEATNFQIQGTITAPA